MSWDALVDAVAAARALPAPEQGKAFERLLRIQAHDPVMALTVEHEQPVLAELAELAAVVREHVPQHAESKLAPRLRIFVALLRRDALEPAWTLAHDNASGVLRPTRAPSMWAGGSYVKSRSPLTTVIEDGRVYAWLPGFRDPRWHVPDDVYDIGTDVVLRSRLDLALTDDDALTLSGFGHLSWLDASEHDTVTIRFTNPGAASHTARATRARRPDLVKPSGPDLTRLAWSGFTARTPLAPLAAVPGSWQVRIEVEQRGATRRGVLGRKRGSLASTELLAPVRETRDSTVEFGADERGGLTVTVLARPRDAPRKPLRQVLRDLVAEASSTRAGSARLDADATVGRAHLPGQRRGRHGGGVGHP